MDAKQKFVKFVTDKGLRRTEQRERVVDLFLATEQHVTVQGLYDLVRKKHRGIGYATVARTMKLIHESGLCRQVDLGDGVVHYEHIYKHPHHDHLICTQCGKFEEIYSPKLEKIQGELVKRHGYVQQSHRLDIFGLCPECASVGVQEVT